MSRWALLSRFEIEITHAPAPVFFYGVDHERAFHRGSVVARFNADLINIEHLFGTVVRFRIAIQHDEIGEGLELMKFALAALERARRAFEQSDFFAQLFRGQTVCKLQRVRLIHFDEVTVTKVVGGVLGLIPRAAGIEPEADSAHGETFRVSGFSRYGKKIASFYEALSKAEENNRAVRQRFPREGQ